MTATPAGYVKSILYEPGTCKNCGNPADDALCIDCLIVEGGENGTELLHDRPFSGLSHPEVLALEVEAERYLIEDLVPAGAVGTIAGVPETHKSFLAQAIALGVATGTGEVLGCQIASGAPVGYFWQDDSTREEVERIKLYDTIHTAPDDIPLRWYLNEGVELPRDFDRLIVTIQANAFGLVVLDSFYNFAGNIDLKESAPEQLVALLKREVSDALDCSVLIVDHMAWATETNRGRLRAYGGVFKNAATRFGIYIDAQGKKLYVEARGNNIRGFAKTPAYWDADTLEIKLVDMEAQNHEELLEARIEAVDNYLREHPGKHSTSAVRRAVKGRATITDQALETLKNRAEIYELDGKGRDEVRDEVNPVPDEVGRGGRPRYWISRIHHVYTPSLEIGTRSDEVAAGHRETTPSHVPIGDGVESGRGSDVSNQATDDSDEFPF